MVRFTEQQKAPLLERFAENDHISREDAEELAAIAGLEPIQVMNFFENERRKRRRQEEREAQEAREAAKKKFLPNENGSLG